MIIIQVHYFNFDYPNYINGKPVDSGQRYCIGIEGESKAEIYEYLQQYSHDVSFVKSKKQPHRSEKGCRRLPCGIVRSCVFKTDKINTFNQQGKKYKDNTYIVYEIPKDKLTERTIERYDKHLNTWDHLEFKYLESGDVFRTTDNGEPPSIEYVATSDAYMNNRKEWQIETRG